MKYILIFTVILFNNLFLLAKDYSADYENISLINNNNLVKCFDCNNSCCVTIIDRRIDDPKKIIISNEIMDYINKNKLSIESHYQVWCSSCGIVEDFWK